MAGTSLTASGATALPPAIFLMGPTACGKTDLAVALVQRLAPRHRLELISVDSALVYRGLDIGTAKPDAAVLAAAPHHLIDILDPTEAYSAGRFQRDARALMADISARGHVPLLVGGTMLYFKALLGGLDDLPAADPALRADLEARARRLGWPALHAELAALDPASAARLTPNDSQRIQRALELCLTTGLPLLALHARADANALPYRVLQLALLPAHRAWLHARIDRRFAAMLAAGLVDEVRGLRQRHALHAGLPAMRCVGYRQAWQVLAGERAADTLLAAGQAATRQLAKRQLTWLRGWHGAIALDCQHPELAAQAGARVAAFLG